MIKCFPHFLSFVNAELSSGRTTWLTFKFGQIVMRFREFLERFIVQNMCTVAVAPGNIIVVLSRDVVTGPVSTVLFVSSTGYLWRGHGGGEIGGKISLLVINYEFQKSENQKHRKLSLYDGQLPKPGQLSHFNRIIWFESNYHPSKNWTILTSQLKSPVSTSVSIW